MNEMGNDLLNHLRQFAAHKNVQIAAIGSKSAFIRGSRIVVLKKLDIAHLPSEKLRKYHQEGRIAFILDGHQVQFNKTYAEANLVDLDICQLKVRHVTKSVESEESVEEEPEILENVEVTHLDQEEYDEIVNVCHEVLASLKKSDNEESTLAGKVKSVGSYDSSVRLALKHILMLNVMNEMSDIINRLIQTMEKSREEEHQHQKIDQKKQEELKERLTKERLNLEIVKKEIEKNAVTKIQKNNDAVSDEKRNDIARKTGKPISERQA